MRKDPWRVFEQIEIQESGCWNTTCKLNGNGYGTISINGNSQFAHRVAYQLYYGIKLSNNKVVRHKCNNRKCVNPKHLLEGNTHDNMTDCVNSKRHKGFKNHVNGIQHGNSRLTEQQVRDIRNARGTLQDIGYKYGISFQHAADIIHRRRWAHVI